MSTQTTVVWSSNSRGDTFVFFTYFFVLYIYIYIKPLKSEAIHETGLSGNVVASFFPLIIYIYLAKVIFSSANLLPVNENFLFYFIF